MVNFRLGNIFNCWVKIDFEKILFFFSKIFFTIQFYRRFGMGWLADYVGRLLILRVSFFAMAACMLIVAFLESLWLLWLFVLVFGAMAGSFISLLSPVCSELFPTLLLPTLTAGVYAGGALGNLFGSPLSGAIIDSAGGYFAAFM